jgi:preprotein translocase SecE subunit
MSRFIDYIQDTRAELRHVAWPTQRQAIIYTTLVVGVSAIVAAFVGAFDYLFTQALDWFIQ